MNNKVTSWSLNDLLGYEYNTGIFLRAWRRTGLAFIRYIHQEIFEFINHAIYYIS